MQKNPNIHKKGLPKFLGNSLCRALVIFSSVVFFRNAESKHTRPIIIKSPAYKKYKTKLFILKVVSIYSSILHLTWSKLPKLPANLMIIQLWYSRAILAICMFYAGLDCREYFTSLSERLFIGNCANLWFAKLPADCPFFQQTFPEKNSPTGEEYRWLFRTCVNYFC